MGKNRKLGVLGSRVEHDYTGVFEKSFELRVGDSVRFVLSGSQVIEHPFLLVFFGDQCLLWGLEGAQLELQGNFPHN